jgi:FKBP-type peptidyl-prolyl cis-trans isomerase FkpA
MTTMQNGKLIGFIALGVLVVVTVGLAIVLNRPQAKSNSQAAATSNQQTNTQGGSMQLEKTDEVVGTGAEATVGKTVSVNYVGTLTNGTKFDSSYDRNQPFEFKLGSGQVIQGWDEGVAGMKVGGKRKLVIPPDLGYGAQGAGSTIPPNSTLVFEIELLDVK